MKVKEIGHINEALLVLKHFIDLSAKLLPLLEELNRKKTPSFEEKINKKRIIDIYQHYEFDTNTSRLLINSNVLELIQTAFIEVASSHHRSKNRNLRKFLKEHHRLMRDWQKIGAN